MEFVFQALFEFFGYSLTGSVDVTRRPVWQRLLLGLALAIVAFALAVLLLFVLAFLLGFLGLAN